jgi:hypothetical protein
MSSEQCAYQVYIDRCGNKAIPGGLYCAPCTRRFIMEAKQHIAKLEHELDNARRTLSTLEGELARAEP